MKSQYDAVVVGSGPNGLAAAIVMAQHGHSVLVMEGHSSIGGGTRTEECTVPGVLHDICSAVHPFAAASPLFQSLPLSDHGLTWCYPEVDLAHPLDEGRAALFWKSLDQTCADLGEDGSAWRKTFAPLVERFDSVRHEILGPLVHIPRHPIALARFGLRAGLPATRISKRLGGARAQALFAGAAAHLMQPLTGMTSASVGTALLAAGHAYGWPVAQGGSHMITTALASYLTSLGGEIITNTPVTALTDLPPSRYLFLDVSPKAAEALLNNELPARKGAALRRWKYGPAAYKMDLAVEGGIPWSQEGCRSAGTVHLGGSAEEVAATELLVARGRMPEHPFVLVAQQYLADPSRSNGDVHPIWAYAHVPHGYDGDATEAMLQQFERFAPGTRERIVGMHVTTPAMFEAYNPNYVGGDIATGANSLRQLVARPSMLRPYATGRDGTFLCSAATPPGAGVHGMSGYHAAHAALRTR